MTVPEGLFWGIVKLYPMIGSDGRRLQVGPWGRVLMLWSGLSLVVVVMALADVLPLPEGPLRVAMVAANLLGPAAIILTGGVLAYHARRPWIVIGGTVAVLWAAMSVTLGCPARFCPEPTGYEHWRNIKLAVDLGVGGPRLLVSSRVEACAFDCPYKLQLIPLAIGYLTYAHALTTDDS